VLLLHTAHYTSTPQRTVDFHECAVKAIACLHKYAELRVAEEGAEAAAHAAAHAAAQRQGKPEPAVVSRQCPSKEALYNIARAYQLLGLQHFAESYYWRCLKASTGSAGALALQAMAAHNLAKLYQEAGAASMARHVLQTYLTVG
jgi:hypothetical protein